MGCETICIPAVFSALTAGTLKRTRSAGFRPLWFRSEWRRAMSHGRTGRVKRGVHLSTHPNFTSLHQPSQPHSNNHLRLQDTTMAASRSLKHALLPYCTRPARLTPASVARFSTFRNLRSQGDTANSHAMTWVRLHERVPASVGILDAAGVFCELIPVNTPLPVKCTRGFHSAFDYTTALYLEVAQRTIYYPPIKLAALDLQRVRFGRAGLLRPM